MKELFLAIVAAALVVAGLSSTSAFTILEFKPVLSDKGDPSKRETNFNHPAQACPTFVRSSFVSPRNGCDTAMTREVPPGSGERSSKAFRHPGTAQHAVPAKMRGPGDPATTSRENGNACERLNTYMERLVHIYSRSVGEEKGRRLALLDLEFKSFIERGLPMELHPDLEHYRRLCECIHGLGRSGLSLSDIYSRGLCGQISTKEKRSAIISKCRNCMKFASQQ